MWVQQFCCNFLLKQAILSMQVDLLYNNGHPQRKKLFQMNDRHNLSSSLELHWIGSLKQSQQLIKNKVIEEKKHAGVDKMREEYNKYVQKRLQNREDMIDKFATIVYSNSLTQQNNNAEYKNRGIRQKIGKPKSISNANQDQRKQSRTLDQSLIQQVQNFNTKRKNSDISTGQSIQLSNSPRQRYYSISNNSYDKKLRDLSPQMMKQHILRSAFDRPEYYAQNNNCKQINLFKKVIPDALQGYLRPEPKKWGR